MSKFNVVVPADEELPEFLRGKGYVGIQHAERPWRNLLTTKAALLGLACAEDLKAYLAGFEQAAVGSMFGAEDDCTVAVIPTELTSPEGQQALLVTFNGDILVIATGAMDEDRSDDEYDALRADPEQLADLFEQIKAL